MHSHRKEGYTAQLLLSYTRLTTEHSGRTGIWEYQYIPTQNVGMFAVHRIVLRHSVNSRQFQLRPAFRSVGMQFGISRYILALVLYSMGVGMDVHRFSPGCGCISIVLHCQ